jgi:hypothetical protein
MTSQERESMAIACCLICTLAEVMKACQVCPFRKGLEIKAQQENTRVLPNQTIK